MSLMRFFSSSLMESLPPKSDVASSGLIWSTVFSPMQRQIFSVVAESNGLFPEAFSTQASVAERTNSVRKLWVNSSLNSFFADSLHAQSRSVQARGVAYIHEWTAVNCYVVNCSGKRLKYKGLRPSEQVWRQNQSVWVYVQTAVFISFCFPIHNARRHLAPKFWQVRADCFATVRQAYRAG